ncbi:hypothetical protein B0H16DRAFT_1309633 [Mycena metata]|uniref:Secreted protein n=1 Tax=Mycena metata TaxID=1033252 RepID=A0AAD7JML1_9AGAR|nr:hypothetical protein B0H16DRAFT_1309633 [Mycena metata]
MKTPIPLAVLLGLSITAYGICPGFNFAIGNIISLGEGVSQWNVYNSSCFVIDGLTTTKNPCTQGIFGCSPTPIFFDHYTSSITGLNYTCLRDPNSEVCGNDVISVCVRAIQFKP